MIPFPLKEALRISGGKYFGDPSLLEEPVTNVSIDTRTLKAEALYVPVRGEAFDGHRFIPNAFANGALCTLSETETPYPHIRVSDAVEAFQALAHGYRLQFNIPIVGITGSAGKTTTKEMVSAVLSTCYSTLATKGNLNNQTGVPQVLFSLENSHECAVIEMGTNHFGEIDRLAAMTEPTLCLLTNIGEAHIEFFGSREGIFRGKTEMLRHLRPGGTILVNGDDEYLSRIQGALTYGFSKDCDFRVEKILTEELSGASFLASLQGEKAVLTVRAPGKHMIENALAAAAVGTLLKVPLAGIQQGIESFAPDAGRQRIEVLPGCRLINDVYNANPTSMEASLRVLAQAKGRRVAILGDMLELGENAYAYHKRIMSIAVSLGIEKIVGVGTLFSKAALEQGGLGYQKQEELLLTLPALLSAGDVILVKGSRGIHLEKTVEKIRELFS